jgi:hypothetical protein
MAALPPRTRVKFRDGEAPRLRFRPAGDDALVVCVHPGALKAPHNRLSLVLGTGSSAVSWVGAVDETMLEAVGEIKTDPRVLVRDRLLEGGRLWEVVRPGLLTAASVAPPLGTIYDGDRPWVVLGELENGRVLAAPLNDASGNPKWWAPQVAATALEFVGSKDSQIELAHLWSFDAHALRVSGVVAETVRAPLGEDVLSYYSG